MSTLAPPVCSLALLALFSSVVAAQPPGAGGCPSAEQMLATLAELPLSRASRSSRYSAEPPVDLYTKAAAKPEHGFARSYKHEGFAALVTELPVSVLWKAINDEDHFDADGGFLPVAHSEVVDGSSRGTRRLVFQVYSRWGIGRWWSVAVRMNATLFEETDGALWEVYWDDDLTGFDASAVREHPLAQRYAPLKENHGAWLLVPLDASCTLAEYYTWSDPGGALAVLQKLRASASIRSSIEGMVRLAREHIPLPHPDAAFVYPDGRELP